MYMIVKIVASTICLCTPWLTLMWMCNGCKRFGNRWNKHTTIAFFLSVALTILGTVAGLSIALAP